MRLLLVKTSSLGDVIHALPALTDAAAAVAEIRFDWLVEEAFARPALAGAMGAFCVFALAALILLRNVAVPYWKRAREGVPGEYWQVMNP